VSYNPGDGTSYDNHVGLDNRQDCGRDREKALRILDKVRELKQSTSELEDENRELREKLRFKSDEYEFRNPYWYHKAHPNERLCPKCFARGIAAAMSNATELCLVCKNYSI
jgi:hypothetical protein